MATTTPTFAGDRSRPPHHITALRAAWQDGHNVGERGSYVRGWRWGVVCGAIAAYALLVASVALGYWWTKL